MKWMGKPYGDRGSDRPCPASTPSGLVQEFDPHQGKFAQALKPTHGLPLELGEPFPGSFEWFASKTRSRKHWGAK